MADEQKEAPDPLGKAADRLRETTKWLITLFAGVAAALIAGSQLTDLGDLSGWRLVAACAAVVVAITSVAYAINAAAFVMTSSRVSLAELASSTSPDLAAVRTSIEADPTILAGYANVSSLNTDYATALGASKQAYDAYYADPTDTATSDAADVAGARMMAVDQTVQRLLDVASFDRLTRAFDGAKSKMLGGAILAALAIVGFAVLAHPDEDDAAQRDLAAPTLVTLELSGEGREILSKSEGPRCRAGSVRALVLGYDGKEADVVTIPNPSCRSVHGKVAAKLGEIHTSARRAAGAG